MKHELSLLAQYPGYSSRLERAVLLALQDEENRVRTWYARSSDTPAYLLLRQRESVVAAYVIATDTVHQIPLKDHEQALRTVQKITPLKIQFFKAFYGIGGEARSSAQIAKEAGISENYVNMNIAPVLDVLRAYHKRNIWYNALPT